MDLNISIKNFLSKIALVVLVIAFVGTYFNIKKYRSQRLIENDIISYYAYLPAAFVHHDLTLSFLKNPPPDMAGIYWPETAPNGGLVIKTTMGLAVLYLPFYGLGHLFALMDGSALNGHSPPYYFWVGISGLIYALWAFFILRKMLLRFFSDAAVALALITLGLGTNLFFYITNDTMMSHVFIFFLSVIYIYFLLRWHENPGYSNSILLGLMAGLLTLARPLCILYLLLWIFYGVSDWKSLKEKFFLFLNNVPEILLAALAFILIWMPQLTYWKINAGVWFFNSYQNERFFLNQPHLIESLFGFRKGWLVYTPLMALSLIGIVFLFRKIKPLAIALLIFSAVYIYFLSSWWAWWFGGSFGNRGYVDIYTALSFPLAAFFSWVVAKKKILRIPLITVVFVLVAFQLFQTLQYRYGAVHYDGMTREAYSITFLKLRPNDAYYKALREPDYENAKAGLPERELIYH